MNSPDYTSFNMLNIVIAIQSNIKFLSADTKFSITKAAYQCF